MVPHGHPLAGSPMELPDFGVAFLRDVLLHRESLLCVGRKNGKSAIVAAFILALLAGPLRRPGLRVGCASVTQQKSAELLRQAVEIIAASELQGVELRKSPTPGYLLAANGSTCEFLSFVAHVVESPLPLSQSCASVRRTLPAAPRISALSKATEGSPPSTGTGRKEPTRTAGFVGQRFCSLRAQTTGQQRNLQRSVSTPRR